jgi:hypothetical protein
LAEVVKRAKRVRAKKEGAAALRIDVGGWTTMDDDGQQ